MEKKRPILSISMLASDRMDTLPRCLESLTVIREAFPCELIVVNTCKNPEVQALIEKYADKTDYFEWCHDFAKARNVGVKMAEGEWFMFIDDDEWFAEPEELIEFFTSGEYKNYGYAVHRIKNFHDPEFKTFGYGWVTRLTKMWPDTAFHSKVHEFLVPFIGEMKMLQATSYHSGYIFKTKEDRKAHFKRNVVLLEKMEQEEPDSLRWKLQMLQEYTSVFDWESMVEYGKKTLDYLWGKPGNVNLYDFATIHIAYAIALIESKRYELVEDVYKKASAVVKDTVLHKAYMELCMAQSCWALEKYDEAMIHAKKYVEGYEVFCKGNDDCKMEILGIFASDAFDDNRITKAYSVWLSSELRTGNDEKLYELYPKLKWNKESINGYCEVEVEILDTLVRKKDYKMLEHVLQEALSTTYIRPRMMKAILDWKHKDDKQFIKLLEIIKTLDVQNWYKEYATLLTFGDEASKEEVLESAKKFILLVPSVFAVPSEIAVVLERFDTKVADLYMYIEFDTWKQILNERLEEIQMEQVEELKVILEDSILINDIRYYYFMMVFMEQKILVAEKNQLSFDELTELLVSFSEYTRLAYEDLYGEELQLVEVENWPKKYLAAKWLEIFYVEVGNDMSSAMGCLAKVIATYPRLAKAMKYYLERIQSEILNG